MIKKKVKSSKKVTTKVTKKKIASKSVKKNFHNYQIENAKTIQDCEEIAIVDAYDEYEQAAGWFTCLEEVFCDCNEVLFMGEVVQFKYFDQGETSVTAVIGKKGKTAKVSLESIESIELIKPSRLQALWHKAYLEYHS
ncbi:MAG: hypothetical protein HQK50_13655 [Oligoflexia bacterium]|nr:hypothetical protein [Oligoflexia bacterium]